MVGFEIMVYGIAGMAAFVAIAGMGRVKTMFEDTAIKKMGQYTLPTGKGALCYSVGAGHWKGGRRIVDVQDTGHPVFKLAIKVEGKEDWILGAIPNKSFYARDWVDFATHPESAGFVLDLDACQTGGVGATPPRDSLKDTRDAAQWESDIAAAEKSMQVEEYVQTAADKELTAAHRMKAMADMMGKLGAGMRGGDPRMPPR